MPDLLFIPVALAYLAVLLVLFVYGLYFLYLTVTALRAKRAWPRAAPPADWPVATVQLPIYNEMYVAERVIDAAARLEYPAGRLEIQVLDDSTDETAGIVSEVVERWRAAGKDIRHVRRPARTGYKAGALAYGLEQARGSVVAILDADFVVPPDFLMRTVPVLEADPGLAFVQARWGHTNRDHSLLTSLQALSIDGHFAIEQTARSSAGHWFNFNGTAGVWRREALVDAGGWNQDTLTEDLDLSYRAFMRGWRAAYLGDVEVPGELPVSFNAYRRQQHRWARGSFECAIKHLPAIWRQPITWRRKLQATLHLGGYSIHLLLLALSLLYPLVLLIAVRHPMLPSLFGIIAIFNLTALVPAALFAAAQRQLGRRWWTAIPRNLLLSVLGAGMMVNTTHAAFQAVRGRPGVFERTPKFGARRPHDDWRRLRYQLGIDGTVVVEILLAGLNLATCLAAARTGVWAVALYTAVFACGLLLASGMTIGQTLRGAWVRRSDSSSVPVQHAPEDARLASAPERAMDGPSPVIGSGLADIRPRG